MKKLMLSLAICGGIAFTAIAAGTALVTGSNSSPAPATLSDLAGESGVPRRPVRAILETVARNVLNFRHETPLTADQKEKIVGILKNHKDEIRAQFATMRDARRAMRQAVADSGPDSQAAKDAAAKIGDAARDGALLKARIGSEIRPLLTDQQLKRVKQGEKEVDDAVDSALTQ